MSMNGKPEEPIKFDRNATSRNANCRRVAKCKSTDKCGRRGNATRGQMS